MSFKYIQIKSDVTEVGTILNDVILNKQGVCEDFPIYFTF